MAQRTDDNKNWMQLLFFVESIYNEFKKQDDMFKTFKTKMSFSTCKETTVMTETGRYISLDLRGKINALTYQYGEVSYTFCNVPVSIKVYKPPAYPTKKVEVVLELIAFLIFYCKSLHPSYRDKLVIKIILSPFRKELVEGESVFTAYNVNSGFTFRDYSQGRSSVVVYRAEEVNKVLIHELLHAFDMDCKTSMMKEEEQFAKMFGLYTGLNINESFTDAYACLLNVVYASILLSRRNQSLRVADVGQALSTFESLHIIMMGRRVLAKTKSQRRESTNVMAYYVLKAILWSRLDEFCGYLNEHHFMIGSCRSFATHMSEALTSMHMSTIDDLEDRLKECIAKPRNGAKSMNPTLKDAVKKQIKHIKLNSIRMSSIDIL